MEPIRDQRGSVGATLVFAAILLTACGTGPPPREQLAAADLAIRAAHQAEADARAHPRQAEAGAGRGGI